MTKKHQLFMLVCCLIPIGALAALFIFNVPLNTVIFAVLILVCPLSHLLMMKFMPHGKAHDHYPEVAHPTTQNIRKTSEE